LLDSVVFVSEGKKPKVPGLRGRVKQGEKNAGAPGAVATLMRRIRGKERLLWTLEQQSRLRVRLETEEIGANRP